MYQSHSLEEQILAPKQRFTQTLAATSSIWRPSASAPMNTIYRGEKGPAYVDWYTCL
jgi:hypothetical protein